MTEDMEKQEQFGYQDEFCYITPEGVLHQKDNKYFKGRALQTFTEASEVPKALRHFRQVFETFAAQVQVELKAVEDGRRSPDDLRESLEKVFEAFVAADAIGDFDAVLSTVTKALSSLPAHEANETVVPLPSTAPVAIEEHEEENTAVDAPEIIAFFEEIANKAKELAESDEWQYAAHELDGLKFKWDEAQRGVSNAYKLLAKSFNEAREAFYQRRAEFYKSLTEKRLKNLETKRDLLKRLEAIVADAKWSAEKEIRSIEQKWEAIRQIPADQVEALNAKYNQLKVIIEEKRVELVVKRREKEEENLTGKLFILDRIKLLMNSLDANVNWTELSEQMDQLTSDWKKIGKVTRERAEELWKEFNEVVDGFEAKRYELDEQWKKEIERSLQKKQAICEKAESLLEEPDLAVAAREMNKLHKKWKESGMLPRDKSEELWNRFKVASDTFNKKKNENLDQLKDQEEQNYLAKVALCEKAETLGKTEDLKSASDTMQKLMDEWKEIGPAPRRKSNKVWRRFKKAMDAFYEHKREHFRDIRKDQKDNLDKKREVIDQIVALASLESADEALKKVKELQDQYNAIGFVPIKYKDKLYKRYKEACDAVYQRSRAEGQQARSGGYERRGAGNDQRKAGGELQKLRRQYDELNSTILNYRDTKTFIKPNKQGLKLREEIDQKIEAATQELQELAQKMEALKQEKEG